MNATPINMPSTKLWIPSPIVMLHTIGASGHNLRAKVQVPKDKRKRGIR